MGSRRRRDPVQFPLVNSWALRRLLPHAVLIALGLGLAGISRAQTIAYGVTTGDTLFSVDLSNGTTTTIGSTGAGLMEGLALSATGQLYGTDSSGNFYSFNLSTGAATLIGSTAQGNIEALDFLGSTLLGASFSSAPTIFSIDTATGTVTNIVSVSSALSGSARAMAILESNTAFLTTDMTGGANLYKVDLTTGAPTLIGFMAVHGSQFAAMDIASDGQLYGLDNDGSLWLINQSSAAVTFVANAGSHFWLDMTAVSAIPEPSTYALFALGLGVVLWRRRRR